VIYAVNRGLDAVPISTYTMIYFEERVEGPAPSKIDRLRVKFDPDWRTANRSIYLGVEGVDAELSSVDCQEVLRAIDMKLGGATRVEDYFHGRLKDIQLVPLVPDRPRVLPSGFVYYRIEADATAWQDVVKTGTMILMFNPSQVRPEIARAAVPAAETELGAPRVARVRVVAAGAAEPRRKISFALFVV
jgi:hypothetical protein